MRKGISIFRSNRPGLSKAGSRVSGLFVAMMSFVLPRESNPSIWLRSCRLALCRMMLIQDEVGENGERSNVLGGEGIESQKKTG